MCSGCYLANAASGRGGGAPVPEVAALLVLLLVVSDHLGGGDAHLHAVHHELASALQRLTGETGFLGGGKGERWQQMERYFHQCAIRDQRLICVLRKL